jgi:hypothetical protein
MGAKEKLLKRIQGMTEDEVQKLLKDQEAPPPTTPPEAQPAELQACESELEAARARITELEQQLAATQTENQDLKSTDSKVQAVQRAFPHMKTADMSKNDIYKFYDALKNEGMITDAISTAEEQFAEIKTRYDGLVQDKLSHLTDALIDATKDSRKPQSVETVDQLRKNWREKEGVVDEYEHIPKIQKLIQTALDYHKQEDAEKLKVKWGLENYVKSEDHKPFDSSQIHKDFLKRTA